MELILKIIGITLLTWVLIFFISLIGSYFKWKKTLELKEKFRNKQPKIFKDLKVKSVSYTGINRKLNVNSRLYSIKSDMFVTSNEIYFLPQKYSVLIGSSALPINFNKRLYKYSIHKRSENQIHFKWEDEVSDNVRIVEILITKEVGFIDEIESFLREWEAK